MALRGAFCRIEGAAVLAALLITYYYLHASWLLFVALILAPDIAMLGYLRGTRIGAWSYNAFHSYIGPIIGPAAQLQ